MESKKKLLLTGGAGFIGSNLVNHLARENYEIIVLDILDYVGRIENLLPSENVKFVKGDINDFNFVLYLLQEYRIQVILHLAAQSHVDLSFENSLKFTQTNILGTHNLLEAARKYGELELFLHMSTDEVFGEIGLHETESYGENQVLAPTNPYAASKASAELIVKSYAISYKMPTIIVRANNNYGPRQFPEKLIPKFIMLLLMDQPLPIHGSGETRRNFIHVYDTCRALQVILEKGQIGECYNIGTDCEYSVNEIADLLREKICPERSDVTFTAPDRNFNDVRYFISSEKLRNLGWREEETNFNDCLSDLIEWYRERFDFYAELMVKHVPPV